MKKITIVHEFENSASFNIDILKENITFEIMNCVSEGKVVGTHVIIREKIKEES